MPRDGRILDTRYYAPSPSDPLGLNWDGSPFKPLRSAIWVGERLTRRLRALGLELGEEDHLHLNFVDEQPYGSVESRGSSRSFRLHVSPDLVARLDQRGREQLVADLTCEAIAQAVHHAPVELSRIELARDELKRLGYRMPIEHLRRQVGDLEIRVLWFRTPWRRGSLKPIRPSSSFFAAVEVVHRVEGWRRFAHVMHFDDFGELYRAVAAIDLDGETLVLRPRRRGPNAEISAFRARLDDLAPLGEAGFFESFGDMADSEGS